MIPAVVSTFHSATRLFTTPYATGYLARPIGVPWGAVYFQMKNNAGKIVSATSASTYSALNAPIGSMSSAAFAYQATLDLAQTPAGSLLQCVASPLPDSWPLVEYNVVLFNNNVNVDCYRALAMVQFLVWSFNSDTAIAAYDFLQSVQPPAEVVQANLNVLSQTTCGYMGQFAVFDTIFPYETSIFVAAVVFAAIFWATAIVVLVLHRHPAIRRVGVITLVNACLLFGLNTFTVLLWLGYPTLPICQARPWVSATSFVMLYGCIVWIYQDRLYNRMDINTIIDDTLGAHSTEAAADLKAVGDSIASSGSRKSGDGVALASVSSGGTSATIGDPTKVMSIRAVFILLVGAVNFIIPIIWISIEPPTLSTRQCVGSQEQTFRQAMLFYNMILIVLVTFNALMNRNRSQNTSWGLHFFLLMASLFIPTNFLLTVGTSFTIPDRSILGIALSPAIGILVSTVLLGGLVIVPPVFKALTTTTDDELNVLMVESQVDAFKERSKGLA